MIQTLRDLFTPEQRRVIGNEARQLLENKHFREAFDAVEGYLVEKAKACDYDAKNGQEKSKNIVISLQLLEAIKREIARKVQDGEMATIEIRELEKRSALRRFAR